MKSGVFADQLAMAQHDYNNGDFSAALKRTRWLTDRAPAEIPAWLLQANAAINLGDIETQVAAFKALLTLVPANRAKLAPALATALANRAQRSIEMHRLAEAFADLDVALAHNPKNPIASFNLALAHAKAGQTRDAVDALEHHLSLHGDDLAARALLADWWLKGQRGSADAPDSASDPRFAPLFSAAPAELPAATRDSALVARLAAAFGDAKLAVQHLELLDEVARVRHGFEIGDRLRQAGGVTAARHIFTMSAKAAPGSVIAVRAHIAEALSIPPVPSAGHNAAAERQQQLANIDALPDALLQAQAAAGSTDLALDALQWSNFFAAYRGLDDLQLQCQYGNFLREAVGRLRPRFLEPLAARQDAGPARIGLISSSWRDCTAGHYFACFVEWLANAGFDVTLIQLGPQRDAWTERLAARASHFLLLEGAGATALDDAVTTIRSLDLDLALLPELGMDSRLLPIAACQLARRHAVAWGHPVTSGLPHFNAFFSAATMEPPGAAKHYREPLALLSGIGVAYPAPVAPGSPARTILAARKPSSPLIAVPQSFFKLHPDFDRVLAEVLLASPTAQVLMFDADVPRWRHDWLRRFSSVAEACGADLGSRLIVSPVVGRQEFLALLGQCDLMLDPPHWSGGNTALDALAVGLPIVTSPGRFMRSRQSAAMLELAGIGGPLIAPAIDDLGPLVTERLADRSGLRELGGIARAAFPDLIDGSTARQDFLQHIERLLGTASATP